MLFHSKFEVKTLTLFLADTTETMAVVEVVALGTMGLLLCSHELNMLSLVKPFMVEKATQC